MNVTLNAVAERVGTIELVEYYAKMLRLKAKPDWRGDPGLDEADAERVVKAHAKSLAEHEARQEAYRLYLAERERERAEVGLAAYSRERERYLKAQLAAAIREREHGTFYTAGSATAFVNSFSPQGESSARAAQIAALEDFDRKSPPKGFEEFKGR